MLGSARAERNISSISVEIENAVSGAGKRPGSSSEGACAKELAGRIVTIVPYTGTLSTLQYSPAFSERASDGRRPAHHKTEAVATAAPRNATATTSEPRQRSIMGPLYHSME